MTEKLKNSQEQLADLASQGVATSRKSLLVTADESAVRINHGLLEELTKKIYSSPINGFASLVNFVPTSALPIQRWFRYREGFSIELVKELIKGLPKGATILDPFVGAGTSLLAAREVGLQSVGFDVNPISILVAYQS